MESTAASRTSRLAVRSVGKGLKLSIVGRSLDHCDRGCVDRVGAKREGPRRPKPPRSHKPDAQLRQAELALADDDRLAVCLADGLLLTSVNLVGESGDRADLDATDVGDGLRGDAGVDVL